MKKLQQNQERKDNHLSMQKPLASLQGNSTTPTSLCSPITELKNAPAAMDTKHFNEDLAISEECVNHWSPNEEPRDILQGTSGATSPLLSIQNGDSVPEITMSIVQDTAATSHRFAPVLQTSPLSLQDTFLTPRDISKAHDISISLGDCSSVVPADCYSTLPHDHSSIGLSQDDGSSPCHFSPLRKLTDAATCVKKEENKPHKRSVKVKVTCPLCSESVWNLSRHLRSKKHRWSSSQTKYSKATLGIRQRKIDATKHSQRLRPMKQCTYPGCDAVVARLDLHIRKMHSDEFEILREKIIIQTVMSSFENWMKSPDSGGLTDATVSNQHYQTQLILECPETSTFSKVLDEFAVSSVFTRRVNNKKWSKKAAATYLFSLNIFYKFLGTSFFASVYSKNPALFRESLEDIKSKAASLKVSTVH